MYSIPLYYVNVKSLFVIFVVFPILFCRPRLWRWHWTSK